MESHDRIVYSYIILGVAMLAFAVAAVLGYFYIGLIFLLAGLITWLIVVYSGNVEGVNGLIGVVLISSGFVAGLIIFIGVGIRPNIFGGHEIHTEGVVLALAVLLVLLALGLAFLGLAQVDKRQAFFNKELKKFYKIYSKEDNE
ncbi:MAG: hypothetical protein V1681_08725 [Candidatus Neomarinimicrobiota bacterium]